MCQYLPATPIIIIKINNSFQVKITCLHKFKFHTNFNILLCQNNRSEIAVAVKLLLAMAPGVPGEVIGVPEVPGNQLTK